MQNNEKKKLEEIMKKSEETAKRTTIILEKEEREFIDLLIKEGKEPGIKPLISKLLDVYRSMMIYDWRFPGECYCGISRMAFINVELINILINNIPTEKWREIGVKMGEQESTFSEKKSESREEETGLRKIRETRREFLRRAVEVLLGSGLVFLTAPNKTAADGLRKILEYFTWKGVEKLTESEERERLRRVTLEHTKTVNQNFELQIPQNPRILLENFQVTVGGRGYAWHLPAHHQVIAKLIESDLQSVFGGASVVSLDKVREETAERRELRENAEVDQSTIPPSGTIKREDMELDVVIDLIENERDLRAYFRQWGWPFKGFNLDFKRIKLLAIGVLTFREPATQLEHSLIIFGGSVIYSQSEFERALGRYFLNLEERVDDQEQQYYKAIFSALNNAAIVLQELKKKGQVRVLFTEEEYVVPETQK
ncbi:MAG: hypothetical protein QW279_11440 [Candidatus Jordarchaeaceae archaeon]